MIKVGIIGSRDYPVKRDVVSLINNHLVETSNDIKFVSGGCKEGVDKWVKEYVEECPDLRLGDNYREFPPKFREIKGRDFNVGDFHARNQEIAEYSDVIFAFQYNNSSGTQSTIDKCREVGTPVFVFKVKEADG